MVFPLLLGRVVAQLRKSELEKTGGGTTGGGKDSAGGRQRLEAIAAYRQGQREIVCGYLEVAKRLLAAEKHVEPPGAKK